MIGRAGWIILGVMATSAATGSVMVLPMIGAHKQALAEQPRVKSLVNDVVAGEIKILAQRGTYDVTTKTISSVVGTLETIVKVNATLGCWAC